MLRETSRAARLTLNDGTVDRRVLQYVQHFEGLTCDQVETGLDMRHQTASAAIRRLSQRGCLKDSYIRRPTRSGRLAMVWRAA